ncbi:STAS domain protein [compost metagenome]
MTRLKAEGKSIKTVIWDMNTSPQVDISGAKLLKRLFVDLKEKNITLKIVEARAEVRDKLRSENLDELFGPINRYYSVHDLVKEVERIEN